MFVTPASTSAFDAYKDWHVVGQEKHLSAEPGAKPTYSIIFEKTDESGAKIRKAVGSAISFQEHLFHRIEAIPEHRDLCEKVRCYGRGVQLFKEGDSETDAVLPEGRVSSVTDDHRQMNIRFGGKEDEILSLFVQKLPELAAPVVDKSDLFTTYKDWDVVAQEKVSEGASTKYSITFERTMGFVERSAKGAFLKFLLFTGFWESRVEVLEKELVSGRVRKIVTSDACVEDLLIARIVECPATRRLYKAARTNGLKHVRIWDRGAPEAAHIVKVTDANAQFSEHRINMAMGHSLNWYLGTLAFETTNFIHLPRFNASDEVFNQQPVTDDQVHEEELADNWAKAQEEIEWDGAMLHHEAMREAIQKQGWDPSVDAFGEMIETDKNFQTYWEKIRKNKHAETYREDFRKIRSSRKLGIWHLNGPKLDAFIKKYSGFPQSDLLPPAASDVDNPATDLSA